MLLDWSPSVTLKEFAMPARKASTVGKLKVPVTSPKIIVEELSELAPELDRVSPEQATEGVCDYKSRVAAPRRLVGRPAEVEAASDVDLRQSDRIIDAIKNAEVGRVELCTWCQRTDASD